VEEKEKNLSLSGGRTESKGRSEEALTSTANSLRSFESQMSFGGGCVISHPPSVQIFGIR